MSRLSRELGDYRAPGHRAGNKTKRGTRHHANHPFHRRDLRLEQLEDRTLLSIVAGPATDTLQLLSQPLLTALAGFQRGSKGDPSSPLAKVGYDLADIYACSQSAPAKQSNGLLGLALTGNASFMSFNPNRDRVLVDLSSVANDPSRLEADLARLGFSETGAYGRMISGWLPISQIGNLSGLADLEVANPVFAARTNAGSVTSQGDQAMRSDIARSTYGVNGSGVKVGVLSDSFNALGAYATDVSTGDLPAGVQIVQDYSGSGATDEGRAMSQIVYDVAPGSSLAFATADLGEASFASNIQTLATDGCQVITDDVSYFDEPFFQDGVIAQAVNAVAAQGVSYFSAAGNDANQSYQATFSTGSTYASGYFSSASGAPHFYGGVAHDFDPGASVNNFQSFTLGAA